MSPKIHKFLKEVRSLATIILIALLLKVTIVEAYIVPTGSMENTIMTGDFLIGNRFVFGMRTPDWIGIPYTDIGFNVPYLRFPEFRKPQPGDVLIFKYPRDPYHKYVKRCIAGPGDTIKIVARHVYVNGQEYPLPKQGKYIAPILPPNFKQQDIFLGTQGNKDYFNPLRIPQKGDVIALNDSTNWQYVLPLILMDGHTATLEKGKIKYRFTMTDPNDLYRRKKSQEVYQDYFPNGDLLTPWSQAIRQADFRFLRIDGIPVSDWKTYTVEQDYYWAMGDNRDDSLDSRYWGFVPEANILGEALFVYFSLDLDTWVPRLHRIGTVIR
jgi:signal peptidase I